MNPESRFDWKAARDRLAGAQSAMAAISYSPTQLRELLDRRAKTLSQPLVQETGNGTEIVIVRAGQERYGIPLRDVTEVRNVTRLATAPGAPPMIAGLIQVRGEVRVVWGLLALLGKTETDGAGLKSVLLVHHGNTEIGIGINRVEDIQSIPDADRRPGVQDVRHCAWMTSELIPVLKVDALVGATLEEKE